MRFSPQFLDELRARLPVSEVVGRRVTLRKRGREYVGLSPFNREKTPSFTVNDQKGFFHDFSSGKHGDIFGFIMETEGLSFPEAVERLASFAGVPLPAPSPEGRAREERRQSLYEVLELAAKFFEKTLLSQSGAKARTYIAERGIEPAMQQRFRMGYAAPDRHALKEHLGGKGVGVPDMAEAGLLITGDDIAVPFDRFRDRVIFPITDTRSRVVAFGGRAMGDAQPKYLNSPESPLFHKGAMLYNLAAARSAAPSGAAPIVVEGYVDVIAMTAAGFQAAVAPLGTALTPEQLVLLWRLHDEPVLCFDGDQAGSRAAYRAIEIALPLLTPGKSLRFAMLPEGQDPDDLFRSGGRAALEEIISAARPLSELVWQRETQGGGFDTPERRAALEARLGALTRTIADETVRRHYRDELASRLGRFVSAYAPARDERPAPGRRNRMWRNRGKPGGLDFLGQRSPRFAASPIVRDSALPPREALILLTVINHPWLLEAHAEELAATEFKNRDAERLRSALLDAGSAAPDSASLRAAVLELGLGNVLARVEKAITHASDWPARADAAAEDVGAWWSHVLTLHRKARTLHKELKAAEQALGSQPSEENFLWLKDVQGRLAAADGTEALIEGFGYSSGRPVRNF